MTKKQKNIGTFILLATAFVTLLVTYINVQSQPSCITDSTDTIYETCTISEKNKHTENLQNQVESLNSTIEELNNL